MRAFRRRGVRVDAGGPQYRVTGVDHTTVRRTPPNTYLSGGEHHWPNVKGSYGIRRGSGIGGDRKRLSG